ncbi:MAG: hypothetical protein C0607_07870 [Azoarcus sp.]|nr:MAG: hypothetical protein C0607_07870 [Azoarcus sp.]
MRCLKGCAALRALLFVGALFLFCVPSQNVTAMDLAPDYSVLRRIEALEENHGLRLGSARVLGDFNAVARRFDLHRTGPRSRNYSLKMVWAPERQRALFAGANHGKPHRLNYVWEFDLAALAWVMLYPPDNPRSYDGLGEDASDVVFEDGLLITRRGGPAVIGHTWWGITYDPVNRQMLFMNIWLTKQDEAVKQLGGDPSTRYKGPPLWAFEPASGKWSAVKSGPPGPGSPYGAMLEYVPELGGAIWHMNNWQMRGTWLYEPSTRRWSKLNANAETKDFGKQAPSRELVGYYDHHKKQVVAQQGKSTFHFDVVRRQWTKVIEEPEKSTQVPFGHDSRSVFYHDPASGHGLFVNLVEGALWAYDPTAVEWKRLDPRGDPMPKGKRMLAYVDPERNVLVLIDDTEVWAYRYKRR